MKHRVWGNHLHRDTNAAKALYRSLVLAVLKQGKIKTTLARAKAIRGDLDKMINWSKEGSLSARRLMIKALGTDSFFDKYTKSFSGRNSGFSRILKLGQRMSDTAEMVILELVEGAEETPVKAEEIKDKGSETKEKVKETGKKEVKTKPAKRETAKSSLSKGQSRSKPA